VLIAFSLADVNSSLSVLQCSAISYAWVSAVAEQEGPGVSALQAETSVGRQFVNQKLIFESNVKVLTLLYYFWIHFQKFYFSFFCV